MSMVIARWQNGKKRRMTEERVVVKRLMKEWDDIHRDPPMRLISIGLVQGAADDVNENVWLTWKVVILGPENTPYHGGVFFIEFRFDEKYPFVAPEVKMITPIWHPNIHPETGHVGLPYLTMPSSYLTLQYEQWSSAKSTGKIIRDILDLLEHPSRRCSYNKEAANQLVHDPEVFQLKALEWTNFYAIQDTPGELDTSLVKFTI